ncbi:hypothetical protein NPIL_421371 [Nephila pilipes]|uniref:Essential MCU regulator, mitochondrial n=1 Tax=Nephila pilipes TaxID=299642 RepID=A0A8X6T338_NEPPI|nr:hypothetical protein NPIL_421371 [Nephila pilipes]
MASQLLRLVRCVSKNNNAVEKLFVMPVRHAVTSDSGAMLPKPEKMPFGLLRVMFTVLPGLYLGATISKEGAAFLEENDIFVPDEDDDED